MSKKTQKSWQKIVNLLKGYFVNSDQKLLAWLLLIGTILCVVGLVALTLAFTWWSTAFWAALAAKALVPFLINVGYFVLLVGAIVGLHTLKNYLITTLSNRWRSWLTNKIIKKLFQDESNFLNLKRHHPEIKNVSQRIQEDVKQLVELTLNMGADLLKSALSLVTFVGSLWVVGGALTVVLFGLNIVIPGYLVWVALIIAITASAASYFLGDSLAEVNKNTEDTEADLRRQLEVLNDNAENIAEEHSERYHHNALVDKVSSINGNADKKLNVQSRLNAFKQFYLQSSSILPIILSAPLYFTGLIELAQLSQIAVSFMEVSFALSWLVDNYENLSKYEANMERVAELENALEKDGLVGNRKAIVRIEKAKVNIHIKHLNIATPQASSTQYMMQNLNLKLKAGEHVLIKGESGLGKSTLFKTIAGTWNYGEGKITIPAGKYMYFLPQKPSLYFDTLKGVLAYPDAAGKYSEEQYLAALTAVGGGARFIPLLQSTQKMDWSEKLSGGEQQRISFARALLKQPDWLFLDEATSAMDEGSERKAYEAIRKELKDTTMVSIAHRSTVAVYHSKVVNLSKKEDGNISIVEGDGNGIAFDELNKMRYVRSC